MGHLVISARCLQCGGEYTPEPLNQGFCSVACSNRSRTQPPEKRFWPKVVALPNGCWAWTAGLTSDGYGTFYVDGTMESAHVWAYETLVGPVPSGLELDHLCRVRSCVNPCHLEPVTTAVNQQRGRAARPQHTHCRRGHPLTAENVKPHKDGRRTCRICQRLTDTARLGRLAEAS